MRVNKCLILVILPPARERLAVLRDLLELLVHLETRADLESRDRLDGVDNPEQM